MTAPPDPSGPLPRTLVVQRPYSLWLVALVVFVTVLATNVFWLVVVEPWLTTPPTTESSSL